ncbi:MAG TPA: hypothetical protein VE619_11920 [Nitrososphaeraceae archaeon]|nr:hypothetical protein [Nitrososphaeraceae archaeon]
MNSCFSVDSERRWSRVIVCNGTENEPHGQEGLQRFLIVKVPGWSAGNASVGGVGIGVTTTLFCIFLLWSVNPVTELSLPNVCSPKAALLHLPSIRHWFS